MKNKILVLIVSVFLFGPTAGQAADHPILISGFDDVLRQAENTGLWSAALKILRPDESFAGMPELYQVLTKDKSDPRFYLVSAISNLFENRVERLLVSQALPSHQLFLRNWLTEWSIEDFKIKSIQKIIAGNPGQNFIVVFDNSGASVELAKTLKQKFPGQLLAIYLRQVIRKDLPEGALPFFTAFDIAIREYQARRISSDDVQRIGISLLNGKNPSRIFPAYAVCPRDYEPCNLPHSEIENICSQVKSKVREICSQ